MIVVLHFVPSFRVGAIAVDRCRRWPSFCYEPLPPQYLRYIIASAGSCCSFSALNFHILSTSGGPLILSEVAARLCFLKFFFWVKAHPKKSSEKQGARRVATTFPPLWKETLCERNATSSSITLSSYFKFSPYPPHSACTGLFSTSLWPLRPFLRL